MHPKIIELGAVRAKSQIQLLNRYSFIIQCFICKETSDKVPLLKDLLVKSIEP
jgi:hypothetical protein